MTPDGKGRVVGLNLMSRILKVRLVGKEVPVEYDAEEIEKVVKAGGKHDHG